MSTPHFEIMMPVQQPGGRRSTSGSRVASPAPQHTGPASSQQQHQQQLQMQEGPSILNVRVSSALASSPLSGSPQRTGEPEPSERSPFSDVHVGLATARDQTSATASTSYPIRLARAAAAARTGSSSRGSYSHDAELLLLAKSRGRALEADDEYLDDEDDEDDSEDDDRLTEYLSDIGGGSALSRSGLGDNDRSLDSMQRAQIGGPSQQRNCRRRRRRCIPLDEQRAAPPPPIAASSDLSRPLASPTGNRPLSSLSMPAQAPSNSQSSSSSSSSSPAPFHYNHGGAAPSSTIPLPETTNTLGKSERRTQVRRTQKLAYMLGGEVLVDEELLDHGSPSAAHGNVQSLSAAAMAGSSSLAGFGVHPNPEHTRSTFGGTLSQQRGSPKLGIGTRRDSDTATTHVASWSGPGNQSYERELASAGSIARPLGSHAGTFTLNDGATESHSSPVDRKKKSSTADASLPGGASRASAVSIGLGGKVADLDQALASVLRRRKGSVNLTSPKLAGSDSPFVGQSAGSPALHSIQGVNNRPLSSYESTDTSATFGSRPVPTGRLAMRRSFESIRTTMTTSTFAESTLSSLDDAALERRAQAQQREERRRKVAKMTRWLGVVVPTELVTSPRVPLHSPRIRRSLSEETSPRADRPAQNRSEWMTPYGLSPHNAGTGIGAALHGVNSDEVKNKMAKVAGRLIKLGGTGQSGDQSTASVTNGCPSASTSSRTNGLGSGVPPSGADLSALELTAANSKAAAYKQLRPQALDLSSTVLQRARTLGIGSTSPNAIGDDDEDSPLTPVSRVNALSPRERIANVKRANKLERVFGEAPPHVLFAAGAGASPGPRGMHQHSNSAPVTPQSAGPSFCPLEAPASTGIQAALDDLVVALPGSATASVAHNPYATSITSSPRSFRSAYRQSLDSLEYLLDNDMPLLNEMMTALEEDDGSSTPNKTPPTSSLSIKDTSNKQDTILPPAAVPPAAAPPKSPDTPGHRRYHSMTSPTVAAFERSSGLDSRPTHGETAAAGPSGASASAARATPLTAFARRPFEIADDPSQMSPLQNAVWDAHDAPTSAALRSAFWADGDGRVYSFEPRSSFGRSSFDQAIAAAAAAAAVGMADSPQTPGGASTGSGAGASATMPLSHSRRASIISHFSRLSSTPSLSTLNSISPPGSPRDAVSAEHELRRQRALRAQKLGRFFGAAPNTMPYSRDAGGSVPAATAIATTMADAWAGPSGYPSVVGTSGLASAETSMSGMARSASGNGLGLSSSVLLPGASPGLGASTGISGISAAGAADPVGAGAGAGAGPCSSSSLRTRRLAPRSAGSAKPHNSALMRMLRSLEEEAMEDETLSTRERKEIRDRLNAMRRRGEDDAAAVLAGEMAVL
ncbi:hypothetical protein OC842_000662 [Tilletia horrida]|uniref:Uncharacterized protein n=1 Tax=Tilletia horrida TaxID=155126 RepID=A0AAN6GGN4_9BASI|nr:hypothetical protein OC842_000662 [Tilletia horrida]